MSDQTQADYLDQLAAQLAALGGEVANMRTAALVAKLNPDQGLGAGSQPLAAAGAGTIYNQAMLAPNSVVGSTIADGSIGITKFATSIIPPRVVTSLPGLPDSAWPQGSLVFLTTDQKLYRNTTGSAWSRATDGADILADSITAGQIAAGAIGADELAVGGFGGGVFITNPGFEMGNLTGWTLWNPNNCGYLAIEEVALGGSKAGTGKYQCLVAKTGTGAGVGLWMYSTSYVPVRPGQLVATSALMYVPNAGGQCRLVVQFVDKDKAYLTETYNTYTQPGFGFRGQVVAAAPANAAYALVGVTNLIDATGGTGWLVVDDFRVQVGDADLISAAGNVVVNSSGVAITGGALSVVDGSGKTWISGGAIATDSITATQIAANAVSTSELNAGAVTADKVAAQAITADKLLVGGGVGTGITNPGFENGTTNGWIVWDPGGAGGFSVEPIASAGIKTGTGTYHGVISKTSNPGAYPQVLASALPCSPGCYVSTSFLIGGCAVEFWINWLDVNMGYIAQSTHAALTPSSSNQNIGTFHGPAPANAYYCQFVIANAATSSFPQYVCFDDVRVSVGDATLTSGGGGNTAIDSSGIRIYNGKLTVASDTGATVIIDGQSQMFKIQASGTIGRQMPTGANSNLNNTVQLTSLGNGFSVPTAMVCLAYINYGAALRLPAQVNAAVNPSNVWYIDVTPSIYVSSGYLVVRIDNDTYLTGFPAGYTGAARYHVLKEAGI